MKRTSTLLVMLLLPFIVVAQKAYRKYSIGIGSGMANVHGDLGSSDAQNIYMGNAEYYLTPYLDMGVELTLGNMSAKGLQTDRYFRSDFGTLTGNIRLYIGHYIDRFRGPMYRKTVVSKIVEGVYTGVGGGIIKSYQRQINRKKDDPLYRGWNTDRDVVIPLSAGIDNAGFNSRIVTGLRYQYNFCFGDNIDGYAIRKSGLDKFSTVSVSLKYMFGPKKAFYH